MKISSLLELCRGLSWYCSTSRIGPSKEIWFFAIISHISKAKCSLPHKGVWPVCSYRIERWAYRDSDIFQFQFQLFIIPLCNKQDFKNEYRLIRRSSPRKSLVKGERFIRGLKRNQSVDEKYFVSCRMRKMLLEYRISNQVCAARTLHASNKKLQSNRQSTVSIHTYLAQGSRWSCRSIPQVEAFPLHFG